MWPWFPSPASSHSYHSSVLSALQSQRPYCPSNTPNTFSSQVFVLADHLPKMIVCNIYKAPSLTIFQPLFQCQFLIQVSPMHSPQTASSTTLYALSLLYFSSQNLSPSDIIKYLLTYALTVCPKECIISESRALFYSLLTGVIWLATFLSPSSWLQDILNGGDWQTGEHTLHLKEITHYSTYCGHK